MKMLKWFKAGELIPGDAKYIKTENKVIGYEQDHDLLSEDPVYEQFHLYEISIPGCVG